MDSVWPRVLRANRFPFRRIDALTEGEVWVNSVALIAFPLLLLNIVLSMLGESFGAPAPSESIGLSWSGLVLLACGSILVFRCILLSWRYQRLSMRQMEELRELMEEHKGVARAAASWMRPGLVLYQGDLRAIRRAAGLSRSTLQGAPVPGWFKDMVDAIHAKTVSNLGATSALLRDPSEVWDESGVSNQAWLDENRALHQGASLPSPSALSSKDSQALNELDKKRQISLVEADAFVGQKEKGAWVATLYGPQSTPASKSVEGSPILAGWFRTSLRSALMKGSIASVALYVLGAVFELQIQALDLPEPGQASDWLGNAVVGLSHMAASTTSFAVWAGLTVALLVMVFRLLVLAEMWSLRSRWWGLPLSPAGLRYLEEIVSQLPVLRRVWGLSNQTVLTQADLAFARRSIKALSHVVRQQETMEELEVRAQALESLPSMAEYRARQRSAALSSQLPPGIQDKPRSRF